MHWQVQGKAILEQVIYCDFLSIFKLSTQSQLKEVLYH
jgi:hypothetical protein